MSSPLFLRSGARSRACFRLIALLAVVGMVLLCFLPNDLKMALHTRGRLHPVGHFVVFLCVGYVSNRTSRSAQVRAMLFLMTLLLGFGTEFGEHLVFGTNVEWRDVGVDALGAAVGAALARFSSRRDVGAVERGKRARMRG